MGAVRRVLGGGARGAAAVALLATAVLAGCSDDGSSGTTTTEAAANTTAGPTTTNAGAEALVRALAAVGTWTGTWNNDTFGSTGAASMVLTVDEEEETLDAVLDIGGAVFGGADPAAETFSIPVFPGTYTGSSATFGSYAVTLNADGTISVVSTEMPALPAGTFSVNGTIVGDSFSGTYEVDFGDGSAPATGRFELIKDAAGSPATTAPAP